MVVLRPASQLELGEEFGVLVAEQPRFAHQASDRHLLVAKTALERHIRLHVVPLEIPRPMQPQGFRVVEDRSAAVSSVKAARTASDLRLPSYREYPLVAGSRTVKSPG
jgi:hypothetical protein